MNRIGGSRSWPLLMVVVSACCTHPPLNSMVAAHGNTDWHINTAHKFVYGTGYDTSQGGYAGTSANHVPDTWIKSHIHIGLTDTGQYYDDASRASPAADTDSTNGVDNLMLFFYAGHGSPTSWSTLGGSGGTQSNVLLGNPAGNGYLRYYWQCSCDVFAHGPQAGTCGMAGTFDYACPGDFDGSADSAAMRNVYERWGPALGPDLRMACGASTAAYCWPGQADRIWDDYNNNGYGVADSFIDGLSGSGVVPLCIAVGGDNWESPLSDQAFTNKPNQTGSSYYYIQFLVAPPSPSATPDVAPPPAELPILLVNPPDPPPQIKGLKFATDGEQEVAQDVGALGEMLVKDQRRGVGQSRLQQVRINHASGAIYVRGETKPASGPSLNEGEYIPVAKHIVDALGLAEKPVAETLGARNLMARRPVRAVTPAVQAETTSKNVIVTFRRGLEVQGRVIPVLGNGGVIKVQLNDDGSLINLTKVWRTVAGSLRTAKVKTPDQARAEALKQVPNPSVYKVGTVRWGYKELAGNARQDEMRVVYEIQLVPIDPQNKLEAPPALIEVPAQE